MSKAPQKIGRLAMRHEGENWVAYYALPDTMDDAIFLASIKIRLVDSLEKRMRFLGCMREFVGDLIEEQTGVRPTWPDGAQPAPESERSGHA